jgi:hypothetical protein
VRLLDLLNSPPKAPNNCFNLTQRSSVSQVKQMLDRQSRHKSYGFTPIDCETEDYIWD